MFQPNIYTLALVLALQDKNIITSKHLTNINTPNSCLAFKMAPGSNLGPKTGNHDCGLSWFPPVTLETP